MRRRNKNKQILKLLIVILLLALIIAGIIIAVKVFKKNDNDEEKINETTEEQVFKLPDTSYSGMNVTNVELEYREDNKQTMVSMIIKNTSEKTVDQQQFWVYFYDKNGNEMTRALTTITEMKPNDEHNISIVLTGDFTSISKVELKKDNSTNTETQSDQDTETETEIETDDVVV